MIDVFNCLVKSQKIPIFSVAGEPYNPLLMRIANQTNADVVIIAGMGLRFDDYQAFIDNAEKAGSIEKTVMFIHQATDPPVECLLVPDMALAVAEKFALAGKDVLVLMTDMTAYADAIKEIAITMDQIPSNRGYPGSLYSDLAFRYEKAVDIEGSGSITIISVTTMPGGDVTHPIPDNTGLYHRRAVLSSRRRDRSVWLAFPLKAAGHWQSDPRRPWRFCQYDDPPLRRFEKSARKAVDGIPAFSLG